MSYAIIQNGTVVNVAAADPQFAASQGWIALPEGAGIGWTYDGATFAPPAPQPAPVPHAVTMRQARLALIDAGLLDDIEAAIEAIADSTQRAKARAEWEYSNDVRRDHPLVNAVLSAQGKDSGEIDDLFRAAAAIV